MQKTKKVGAYIYERTAHFLVRLTAEGMTYTAYCPYSKYSYNGRANAFELALKCRALILSHIDARYLDTPHELPERLEQATFKQYATKPLH